MKVCKSCGVEKPIDSFYKNKLMPSGYLNQCIECVKEREKRRRAVKADHLRAYEKARANDPKRVQARKEYAQTEQGKIARQRASKAYQERYPMKYAAKVITRNAIRDGKLIRAESCSECGSKEKVEGHHDDYSKPLEVRWLCEKCHKAWHKYNEPVYLGKLTESFR